MSVRRLMSVNVFNPIQNMGSRIDSKYKINEKHTTWATNSTLYMFLKCNTFNVLFITPLKFLGRHTYSDNGHQHLTRKKKKMLTLTKGILFISVIITWMTVFITVCAKVFNEMNKTCVIHCVLWKKKVCAFRMKHIN